MSVSDTVLSKSYTAQEIATKTRENVAALYKALGVDDDAPPITQRFVIRTIAGLVGRGLENPAPRGWYDFTWCELGDALKALNVKGVS